LVVLDSYQKEQAIERIEEYFDCTITEIGRKELFDMVFKEIMQIGFNTNGTTSSRLKIFSLYQVAIIFIYQELSDISNEPFFDANVKTKRDKESIAELIMIACEFADDYISLNDSEQISEVNKALIKEYKRVEEDINDDAEIKNLKIALFDKNGYAHIKRQLKQVLHMQKYNTQEKEYTDKIFTKVDIYTLMLLFKEHQDDELKERYKALKEQYNIPKSCSDEIENEMKFIANHYINSQDKKCLKLSNHFFIAISKKIHNQAFVKIDKASIDEVFQRIEKEIKILKWHHKIWMKKDKWLLVRNTMQIQKELYLIEQQYQDDDMQTHKFLGNHKVFSLVSVILQEYDKYFHTIGKLSDLTEHDFTAYADVAAMNIKNFYENSTDVIEIEAINRVLFFWMQISRKSLFLQLNNRQKKLFIP
jgi:hypothetical protein